MVMQLTVEICTGLKNNMNTEKMTRCKQVHEHIEYMEFLKVRTFQSFFSKMILSTSFLFQKLVKHQIMNRPMLLLLITALTFPRKTTLMCRNLHFYIFEYYVHMYYINFLEISSLCRMIVLLRITNFSFNQHIFRGLQAA